MGNVDGTVIAQRPKLALLYTPHAGKIACACGTEIGKISVKATTEEGLGFTGNMEGVAAHAVCLLEELG